jgi:hypothetical protein
MRHEAVISNDTANGGQGITKSPVASKKPPPVFRERKEHHRGEINESSYNELGI